jgi:hypothetical protein
MCRQCRHEERWDAIEFIRWIEQCTFREAVQKLLAGSHVAKTGGTQRPVVVPAVFDRSYWQAHVRAAQGLLADSAGAAYLKRRGIEIETMQAFGVGYRDDTPLPGTEGASTAPAILLPWIGWDNYLCALNYRFLKTHEYTNRQGKLVTGCKTTSRGQRSGQVFGLQALAGLRDLLVIVEGEINAMSIWQVYREVADVVSPGSEGAFRRLPSTLIALAETYPHVLVWSDSAASATGAALQIRGAYAYTYPQDANEWLQHRTLYDLMERLFPPPRVRARDGAVWVNKLGYRTDLPHGQRKASKSRA